MYLTPSPKHIRNVILRIQGIEPPYIEEICILMPCVKTFAIIETFMPAFEKLKACDLVPKEADLQGFKIMDEDDITLAYYF